MAYAKIWGVSTPSGVTLNKEGRYAAGPDDGSGVI
jgi:hypothetical protein